MPKSIFKSKTFWTNLAAAALTVAAPGVQDIISAHPSIATGIITAVNVALRFITSKPVVVTAPTISTKIND